MSKISQQNKKKCVVFSVGSKNKFDFEEGILNSIPECEIFTFDHTIVPKNVPLGVKFFHWGLGAVDEGKYKTLNTMLKELSISDGHSLEILKIDIEKNGTFELTNEINFLTLCRMVSSCWRR